MNPYNLLVGALAAHYVTYVLVESTLLDRLRKRVVGIWFLRSVLSCPNCAAFWAGLFVTGLYLLGYPAWHFATLCALASLVQGLTRVRHRLEDMG